jgi:S1-C subfamily serine protease
MTESNESQSGWVPLEGSGVWVPAAGPSASQGGPGWPVPAGTGEDAGFPPRPGPGVGSFGPPPPPPPSGWWGVTPPAGDGPVPPKRRGRAWPVAVAAGALGLAAFAGVGIGHGLWPDRVAAASSGSANTGSGNTGSGSNGSSSGQSPFNSGGSYGESPFGSNGSGDFPFGSGGSSSGSPFDPGNSSGGGTGNSGSTGSSGGPADTSAIAAKVSPALVDVNSTFGYQNAQGAGTGIVLTSNGEILTNNHVINGATKISVTDIGNGRTYSATVVGYDDAHDLAVLQLQGASGLQTAHLGDSSKAAVGEAVVAIGNAGGTGGTPSDAGGSITALDQSITAGDDLSGASEQLSGLIQVNANIQPGDSGGSLVNAAGQVIGIDTAASQGFSLQTSGTEGYAIPINEAQALAQQIEAGKGSSTTHIGPTALLGVELSSSGQNSYGGSLGGGSGNAPSGSGAAISSVVSGGPAAQAGLAAGDTITSLDGQSVASATSIAAVLVPHHPGDHVQIAWVDSSGQSHTATIDLGSGPPA